MIYFFLRLLIALKINLHLSFFGFQSKKGYILQSKKKKTQIRSPRLFASEKGIYFSKKSDYTGKAAIFFNVHANCTVSMCNVKIAKRSYKGAQITPQRKWRLK